MAKYEDELLDHDYDGIQELDNSLPRWWLHMFALTVVFSFIYMFYYHVNQIGYLQEDEYRAEMDPNYRRESPADAKLLGLLPVYGSPLARSSRDITPRQIMLAGPQKIRILFSRDTDTTIYLATIDPAALSSGQQTFKTICAQCHAPLGGGGVGPNLTDDYWLHGATISDLVKSVKYGYPAKGMVPWLGQLSEEEIINVASYALTLRGSNPPDARAPQGDLVEY
jgi:cytochrome c oxidase cbb3-type subunit 3